MITQSIQSNQQRVDAHILTDKVIYKPGDIMFIEVFLFDAFNKTPIQPDDIYGYPSTSYYYSYVYATLNVVDPNDVQIYTSSASAVDSAISFTYQIPEDIS